MYLYREGVLHSGTPFVCLSLHSYFFFLFWLFLPSPLHFAVFLIIIIFIICHCIHLCFIFSLFHLFTTLLQSQHILTSLMTKFVQLLSMSSSRRYSSQRYFKESLSIKTRRIHLGTSSVSSCLLLTCPIMSVRPDLLCSPCSQISEQVLLSIIYSWCVCPHSHSACIFIFGGSVIVCFSCDPLWVSTLDRLLCRGPRPSRPPLSGRCHNKHTTPPHTPHYTPRNPTHHTPPCHSTHHTHPCHHTSYPTTPRHSTQHLTYRSTHHTTVHTMFTILHTPLYLTPHHIIQHAPLLYTQRHTPRPSTPYTTLHYIQRHRTLHNTTTPWQGNYFSYVAILTSISEENHLWIRPSQHNPIPPAAIILKIDKVG